MGFSKDSTSKMKAIMSRIIRLNNKGKRANSLISIQVESKSKTLKRIIKYQASTPITNSLDSLKNMRVKEDRIMKAYDLLYININFIQS